MKKEINLSLVVNITGEAEPKENFYNLTQEIIRRLFSNFNSDNLFQIEVLNISENTNFEEIEKLTSAPNDIDTF